MKRTLLLIFCALGTFLGAMESPGPGQFGLDVEWIYFKPQIDQPIYASNFSDMTNFIGGRIVNNTDFCSGFRVGFSYGLCDSCDWVSLRYTYLDADSRNSTSGPRVIATNVIADDINGTIQNDLDIEYQAGDLLYSFLLCSHGCWDVALESGLHLAYLNVENFTTLTPFSSINSTIIEDYNESIGIGPQLGIGMGYRLPFFPCLRVHATGRAGMLANHQDSHVKVTDQNIVGVNVHDDRFWRVVSFTDIRAGLNTDFNIWCLCGNIEIGYEFLAYWRAVYAIRLQIANDPPSFNIYNDVTYQGPYAKVGFRF